MPAPEPEARYGWDARRNAVVAEGDPDASVERPATRPTRAEDVPHDRLLPDDAEGAGGRGQPEPSEAARQRLRDGRRGFDERDIPR